MRLNLDHDILSPDPLAQRYLPVGEDWGDAPEWIANKSGYGACRVEAGLVGLRNRPFAIGAFFRPHEPPPPLRTKCLADYPLVLAIAHACRAIHAALTRPTAPDAEPAAQPLEQAP